jgi:hypothetical protein
MLPKFVNFGELLVHLGEGRVAFSCELSEGPMKLRIIRKSVNCCTQNVAARPGRAFEC